jgi:hypothetical protein
MESLPSRRPPRPRGAMWHGKLVVCCNVRLASGRGHSTAANFDNVAVAHHMYALESGLMCVCGVSSRIRHATAAGDPQSIAWQAGKPKAAAHRCKESGMRKWYEGKGRALWLGLKLH